MTTITAKTILRSRYRDSTLSALLLRYPRFIHSEFMTHRMLSKNSASSRAIPVSKMIDSIAMNPVVPLWWGKNEPGMQARAELEDPEKCYAYMHWLNAKENALISAKEMMRLGLHKQVINRILEPFSHITVLCSGTEWDNFLELRDHPDAEPHIQKLAQEIKRELTYGPIQELHLNEWHTPFITEEDLQHISALAEDRWEESKLRAILSVARCASTSYKTVDGFDMTLERAQEVFQKLTTSKPIHASPLEHVARADEWANTGNFKKFTQLRHLENLW